MHTAFMQFEVLLFLDTWKATSKQKAKEEELRRTNLNLYKDSVRTARWAH